MKLQTLQINAFRGATKPLTIEFDSQKPITMVFGENGNGKSSISDALICLCTDSIGSLADKSSVDKKFLRALNSATEDVSISLQTTTGNFTAQLNQNGTTFTKTPADGLPQVRQMRRKQVTKLLDAEPSERYTELQEYIDVGEILKCETALRALEKELKGTLKSQSAVANESERVLSTVWEKESKPGVGWEQWSEKETSRDINELNLKLTALNGFLENWRSAYNGIEMYRAAISRERATSKSLITAQENLEKFVNDNPDNNISLMQLLTEAQKYIKPVLDLKHCPVCGKDAVREELVQRIDEQVKNMKRLNELNQALINARHIHQSAKTNLNEAEIMCFGLFNTFCIGQLETVKKYIPESTELFSGFIPLTDQMDQTAYLKEHLPAFQVTNTTLGIDQKEIDGQVKQHNSISTQYNSLIKARNSVEIIQTKLETTQKALALIESTRKEFINEELNSISGTVEALYMKIHPAESIGRVEMSLNLNFKHSIDIHARFQDLDKITPQSLYSESHLDTLGLCIFLALAKKYHEPNTILILDDVMMSVDHSHLERVIEVLHEDLGEFAHIFITTHYRPWRELYRHGRAPASRIQFVELMPWTIERGIRFYNGKVNLEELRQHLNSEQIDRQKLCSLSGVILESIFDFLAVKYQCKMARKPKNEYVLRELTDCLDSKLQKALVVQQIAVDETGKIIDNQIEKETQLQPIIQNLKGLAIIRNWVGAHFNPDGFNISDAEVCQFAELTLEFGELLTCPMEGGFPIKSTSGMYHATRSGRIRMLPFTQPQ
ncbi:MULTISPECIES: AAA family ATPase [Sphingobacterium]|uniref:AAA family ATPase n=1 Tax=Sphingobacterium TaxID=28453 RepID=UPI00257EA735|nr:MULTISPECIES: AAA family ATPase [Sphingobacterium]